MYLSFNQTAPMMSQLPVKAKADYINTRSDFDTLIQGSEFNYLKGATITAGGNIVITPATSRVEQSIHKEKTQLYGSQCKIKALLQRQRNCQALMDQ